MGFLSKLFAAPAEPDPVFHDPILGALRWSNDNEAWNGECNSLKFEIAYTRVKTPDPTLLNRAKTLLADPSLLAAQLAEAKKTFIGELGEKERAVYSPEVDALTIESIAFWPDDRMFISLDGGRNDRLWRRSGGSGAVA